MDEITTESGVVLELLSEAFEGPRDPRSTWFVSNAPDSGIFGTLASLSPQDASRRRAPDGAARRRTRYTWRSACG